MVREDKRLYRQRREKQTTGSNNPDITSPTAETNLVLITAAIDVTENQDVAVIDAPGVFLLEDTYEEVIVILENKIVDAMLEIDDTLYVKYVIIRENGQRHMYVYLRKVMYRNLKSSMLYNEFFSEDIKEYGFVIHPYYPCNRNKWTDKWKITVVWHVNNMKVSHKNKKDM